MLSAPSHCFRGLFNNLFELKTIVAANTKHWTDGSLIRYEMVVHLKGMMPVLKDFLRITVVFIIFEIYNRLHICYYTRIPFIYEIYPPLARLGYTSIVNYMLTTRSGPGCRRHTQAKAFLPLRVVKLYGE